MKKKMILALLLFLGTANFVLSQDTDGDGHADAIDCAPFDPLKWASVIYLDADGDYYCVEITGCFGGILPRWNTIIEGTVINVGYSYSCGGLDENDNDPYATGGGGPTTVPSGDADGDGEPDYTDPAPNDPLVNHLTLEVCNGIDDNHNGLIDEDCSNCIVSAGLDAHLLYGYAPGECVTKTASVTNGIGPFTYSWTLDRALLPGETFTGSNTATVNLCLIAAAELCLTVSDGNNCSGTDCATITVEDVRCFSGNNQKVKICHNGNNICVDQSAVAAHIAHGDYAGGCTGSIANTSNISIEQSTDHEIKIFPNPNNGSFSIVMNSQIVVDEIKTIRVISLSGQVVKELFSRQNQINLNINRPGIYLVQVISNKQIFNKRLLVAAH